MVRNAHANSKYHLVDSSLTVAFHSDDGSEHDHTSGPGRKPHHSVHLLVLRYDLQASGALGSQPALCHHFVPLPNTRRYRWEVSAEDRDIGAARIAIRSRLRCHDHECRHVHVHIGLAPWRGWRRSQRLFLLLHGQSRYILLGAMGGTAHARPS